VSAAWYDDEAAFARELTRGRKSQVRVAVDLLVGGLGVRVGRLQWRDGDLPMSERYEQFKDEEDVFVEGGHLLEIKGRSLRFTSPDDYPFKTAYVGSVRRWSQRTVLPCAVVLLSEPTGNWVVAPTLLRHEWVVERSRDHVRGFDEESYACPTEFLLPAEWLIGHLHVPCGGIE